MNRTQNATRNIVFGVILKNLPDFIAVYNANGNDLSDGCRISRIK